MKSSLPHAFPSFQNDRRIPCAPAAAARWRLAGTGWEPGTGANACPGGGGTYWLTVAGNVIPGQIVEVRFAIFDVGDTTLDSLALLDGFKWLPNATLPGTGG